MHRSRFYHFVIAAFVIALIAGCGRHRGELSDAEVVDRVGDAAQDALDDIDATDAQTALVTREVNAAMPGMLALRKTHKPTRQLIRAELMSEKPDIARIHASIDVAIEEMTTFAKDQSDRITRIHGALEPEQREALATRWQARHERRRRPSAWVVDAIVKRGLDEIEATDSQYEYVLAQKDALMKDGESLRGNADSFRAMILDEWRSDSLDTARIHGEMDAMKTRVQAFAHKASSAAAEFAVTLSAEQRTELRKLTKH